MKRKNLRKKILVIAGIVFILLIIAAGGISYYFGRLVTEGLFYQNEGNDTKNNSILELETWGYDLEAFQDSYTGHDFTLEASDGNTVPVTFFSTDGNADKNTAVLIHGAGGDRTFLAPLAEMYLEHDWNVLTFDMRGHGDNESDLVTFGYLERIDVEALVDYARESAYDKQVIVHGQSMGGAVAGMYAVTDHAREQVDAVIMDSPVHSMEDMFIGVWEEMEDSDGIPVSYMIACGSFYMKLNYGFTFKNVEITSEQQYNEVKTMVIVSRQDNICLPEQITTLYENIASADKTMVEIDCGHIRGVWDCKAEYTSAVMDFLNR